MLNCPSMVDRSSALGGRAAQGYAEMILRKIDERLEQPTTADVANW